MSEGVEWCLHCVTLLALLPPGSTLPAARLGEYHGVPAAYLAKHLQALTGAGIVEATRGRGGGYRLARPAADVTVLDVVEAIDGDEPAFRCTEIRRRGPAAVPTPHYTPMCGIHAVFVRADHAWRNELAAVTLAELAGGVVRDAPSDAVELATRWLEEVLS